MNTVRPRILLTSRFEDRVMCDILRGIITYARQHTTWQLVSHFEATTAWLREVDPAGIVTRRPAPLTHRWAHRTNTPLVMLAQDDDPRASRVLADEEAIGAMAVEHFASLGLKHLAYVGHGDWPFVHQRLKGFAAAAAAHGCDPVSQFIGDLQAPESRLQCERAIKAMLQRMPRPCGLLAANDALGVILVQTCRSIGLRVPEDIAILGVDNDEIACELSEVPLSSIVQPLFAIGYEAARLLHEQIQSKTIQPTSVVLPPTRVVARASTDLIAVDDEDVAAALRLIKNHFAEPISVAWVVDQVPVSRRSLYSRFLKVVGRTVLQQIHHVRFLKAKELLAESDLSLDIVAQRSGFANQTWLTDSFRRELNTTPRRFRRSFKIES